MIKNDDNTVICRCEEVTLGDIKKAIKMGANNLDAIKRVTRAGMGLCQNKTCYNIIARIINKETNIPMCKLVNFTSRPPVRPIPVGCWEKTFARLEEIENKQY